MTHELKTWPEYYQAVNDGDKGFELRKDDRSFEVGDDVLLREWSPETKDYTGRQLRATITYVLRNIETMGLQPGYCVLSIV